MATIAEQFAQKLTEKSAARVKQAQAEGQKYAEHKRAYEFTVKAGKVYDKIMQHYPTSTQTSVHAFVTKDGKLIKAASWAAPQKDKDGLAVRFDLSTAAGFQEAVDASDDHGSYLYKR